MESIYVPVRGKSIPESNNVKFLGLLIDSGLRYDEHCAVLERKLSTALYAIRNLRTVVSLDTLRIFYFAYVESRLRYGVIFWGAVACARRLFILQKRIIRCMMGVATLASCRPIFSDLRILPLPSLYIFEILNYFNSHENDFIRNKNIYNNMETRQRNDLSVPKHTTKMYEMCHKYKAVTIYNKLPKSIKALQAKPQFKVKLKEYLMGNVFYSIDEYMNACNE